MAAIEKVNILDKLIVVANFINLNNICFLSSIN